MRDGTGGVWVVGVPDVLGAAAAAPAAEGDGGPAPRPRAIGPAVLVSRHGGAPAWSPDGKRLAIADLPPPDPTYNGNPERNTDEPPPLFAGGDAFRLWIVDAPLPVDSGAREIATPAPRDSQLLAAFDRVWETLRRLYYSTGPVGGAWQELKAKYRPQAQAAQDEAALETAIDAMVAEQPLIKPLVVSDRAVVVSGHPLASRAGALALEKGGNIVDAAIAVSFALGVVEPDASGIGGDGMAVLYLKGMAEPVAIDYKDQVPIRATRDNPLLAASTGDGAAAANIPGVVAGLDLLYRSYGSKRIPWATSSRRRSSMPRTATSSTRRCRRRSPRAGGSSRSTRSSARIYLPDGKVPKAGERFVNKDYAATLRAIAKDGADSVLSRRDRPAHRRRHGEERRPHHARRPGAVPRHRAAAADRPVSRSPVYSAPPPVSTGATLIETLQILQNYPPRPGASYASDADYLHYAIESWRVRDQGARIADPALWDVDLGPHLDPAHAATLFKRIDREEDFRDRPQRRRRHARPSGSAAARRRLRWPMPTAT